ncbi:MAG: hypothetical protein H7Z43_14550 [Clostridia bacterium]|nr:hypothetical protein [Deltaproteobacteria bacterium]
MRKTLRGVVGLAVVSFFGCADSDRYPERQQVLTGVLAGSVVSQLRYETASQSGFTNDVGEFEYVAGERITFALGGIELGSAAAAEQVTPFELVGLSAPTTEAGLRSGFNTPGFVSKLERASNIAMFLAALDVDRDLNNGIDLTGLDATLLNATLDFNADLTAFPFNRLRPFLLTYDIGDQTVPITTPLAHLYETVGINVAAHLASKVNEDFNGDGTIDQATTNAYDDAGHPTIISVDSNNDGVIDRKTTTTYAGDRVITRLIETSPAGDGTFNNGNANVYAYNAGGLITNQTTEVRNNTLLIRRTVRTYTYDTDSSQVGFRLETDTGGDGTIDTARSDTYSYNTAGVVLQGTVDNLTAGVLATRETNAYTYDAENNQLSRTRELDTNGDGTPDSRDTFTQTYDDSNRQISARVVNEAPIGTATGRSSTTFTYSDDRLAVQVVDTLDPADSTVTSRSTATNTYVGDLLTKVSVTTDASGDGTVEGTSVRTLNYDGNGFVASDITDIDTENDGTLDTIITITNAINVNGNNALARRQTYTDATRTTTVSTTTTEYTPIAEGIHALLYYFGVLGNL